MKRLALFFALIIGSIIAWSQPSTFEERQASHKKRQDLKRNSPLAGVTFKSIGPTVFGGRIVDFDINPAQTNHLFVAYASGGLWYSENQMATATPIFDHEMVMTIGDIAINWQDSIIWVGTGEVNSSRSSFAGTGIYKSTDWGKTWEQKGLGESHHIGRVVLDPTDSNTAWVAVLGKLYTTNPERGVYKTTDGGETWKKTLFIDDNTGVIDLVIDPQDPKTLYAASWERSRKAWNFVESGSGSGMYKSTDGGENWTLLTTEASGFPTGEGVGRIGLDVYNDGNEEIIYALLDNQFRRALTEEKLTTASFKDMSASKFLSLDTEELEGFWKENRFPDEYDLKTIQQQIKEGSITPTTIYEYITNSQSQLFETPVFGAEIYASTDGGKTWKKTHEKPLDKVYFSYGYYFGQIRVNPQDAKEIYFVGVPALKSNDGGQTFKSLNAPNMHVDHHAIWIHPTQNGMMAFGNDGGLNLSYDGGANFDKLRNPPIGQFYSITLDKQEPFNVYGGLQDNGVWKGSSTYTFSTAWEQEGKYPYQRIMGGDGMQTMVDERNPSIVYTGFQFGYYYRLNLDEGTRTFIQPKHKMGERPYRFNWQTPILLSSHNQDILYLGGNKLFRSFNQGDDWEAISEDLTQGGKPGDVAYGTLTCVAESETQFGKLYVGTDDGLVHYSPDGGNSWIDISEGLPKDRWVTKVELSKTSDKVYVALSGYRNDDFKAYLYVTENNGKTWKSLSENLPNEPINVIEEDPSHEAILYVGTDHGLYVSFDSGNSFVLWDAQLPHVSVHDVEVHETNKIVVGTHGRSIYLADLEPVYRYVASKNEAFTVLTDSLAIPFNEDWGTFNPFAQKEAPSVSFHYKANTAGKVEMNLVSPSNKQLASTQLDAVKGINKGSYDLKTSKGTYLEAGEYKIVLKHKGMTKSIPLHLKE